MQSSHVISESSLVVSRTVFVSIAAGSYFQVAPSHTVSGRLSHVIRCPPLSRGCWPSGRVYFQVAPSLRVSMQSSHVMGYLPCSMKLAATASRVALSNGVMLVLC